MQKVFSKALIVLFLCGAVVSVSAQKKGSKPAVEKTPVSATSAYFSLSKKTVDFGNIMLGSSKTIELAFTNTGSKTLVLTNVYTTCGCTTVDWPKEPFMAGKSGVIKITYNPTEEGPFQKTITITTNAENKSEVVQIQGVVIQN
ncbi:MAG: DUF1573 domain-containing protein [Bacteroidales bacterium]|nr:DUF1573 domain-containing protein [Bacteroidales bacterium]